MPLYEYVCQECEQTFETLVRSSDERIDCPHCHSVKVERALSVPARPLSLTGSQKASTCKSSGPPCGPMCGRWQGA
jgi:putative FmdB family regulatory protein